MSKSSQVVMFLLLIHGRETALLVKKQNSLPSLLFLADRNDDAFSSYQVVCDVMVTKGTWMMLRSPQYFWRYSECDVATSSNALLRNVLEDVDDWTPTPGP